MAQFFCPVCNATTSHEEPEPLVQKKAVRLSCKKCGVVRTIENVHTIFCGNCKNLMPHQFRENEYEKGITPICLHCGSANILYRDKEQKEQ